MGRMTALFLLSVLYLSFLANSSAASCPAFVGPKASCGEDSCGHYVFRGKFHLSSSKPYGVAEARNGLLLGDKAAPADCCQQCRSISACVYWNFLASSGACFLYTGDLCTAATETKSIYVPKEPESYVGGKCNVEDAMQPATSAVPAANFPPLPERTFCLLSDPDLHINMRLGGYMDSRAAAASPSGSSKPRVWIRELGLIWVASNGQSHSLRIAARKGKQQERGEGFLARIEVDGTVVPPLALGDEVNLFDGQASILFDAYEKSGAVDVDRYTLRIDGLIEAELRVRPAHPLLQLADDAMAHLNLDILQVHYAPEIHGVLGQAYQSSSETDLDQALDYSVLSSLAGSVVPAGSGSTGASGHSRLEGRPEDYWSSEVLAADCKFSRFKLRSSVEVESTKADDVPEEVRAVEEVNKDEVKAEEQEDGDEVAVEVAAAALHITS